MNAYIWGLNQVVSVADNKEDARKNALIRLKDHPSLAQTVAQEDPIEVAENRTRILYTEWPVG